MSDLPSTRNGRRIAKLADDIASGRAAKVDKAKIDCNSPAILSFPSYYIDKPFRCNECGVDQVWTARQQQWWYEVAKGHVDSTAVRCRRCRKNLQARKRRIEASRQAGLARKAAVRDRGSDV